MRPCFTPALFLLIAVFCSAPSAVGQKGGSKGSGSHQPVSGPSNPLPSYRPTSTEGEFDTNVSTRPGQSQLPLKTEEPPCFHWPLNPVLSSAVSVREMNVPARAREEFE
ncbi:MAG: hypothetical protein ACRD4I_05000, partial [Candidatus Angelobacter sp.]